MTNPFQVTEPTVGTRAVTDQRTERTACEELVRVEEALREVEARRLKITKPQNDAIDAVNFQAKEVSLPLKAIKEELQGLLEKYRQLPEVQEKIAHLRSLKRANTNAALAGDLGAVANTSELIAETDVPLSVDCGEYSVRYREGLELEDVDEEKLDKRYFKTVVDEAAIKNDIEMIGNVRGVTHRWKLTPTVYSKPKK